MTGKHKIIAVFFGILESDRSLMDAINSDITAAAKRGEFWDVDRNLLINVLKDTLNNFDKSKEFFWWSCIYMLLKDGINHWIEKNTLFNTSNDDFDKLQNKLFEYDIYQVQNKLCELYFESVQSSTNPNDTFIERLCYVSRIRTDLSEKELLKLSLSEGRQKKEKLRQKSLPQNLISADQASLFRRASDVMQNIPNPNIISCSDEDNYYRQYVVGILQVSENYENNDSYYTPKFTIEQMLNRDFESTTKKKGNFEKYCLGKETKKFTDEWSMFEGAGVIVGENLVLTASHIFKSPVNDHKIVLCHEPFTTDRIPNHLVFDIDINGTKKTSPPKIYPSTIDEYYEFEHSDYALIKTLPNGNKKNLGDGLQFPLICKNILPGCDTLTFGFPRGSLHLRKAPGKVRSISNTTEDPASVNQFIGHEVETLKGFSGGPVFVKKQDANTPPTLLGIHIAGFIDWTPRWGKYTYGLQMDHIFQDIRKIKDLQPPAEPETPKKEETYFTFRNVSIALLGFIGSAALIGGLIWYNMPSQPCSKKS